MAKKQIEIELISNAKELREQIKGAASAAKQASGASGPGARGLKQLGKKFRKEEQKHAKEALKIEKDMGKQMRAVVNEMKNKVKYQKASVAALREERTRLRELQRDYNKLQKQRKASGVRTPGERVGGFFKKNVTSAGLAGATNFVVGGLVAAVTAAIGSVIGMMASQVREGFSQKEQYGKAYSALAGMGTREQLRGARKRGVGLGFSPMETLQQAQGVARATGQIGAVTTAQRFSRVTGMGVGEVGGFMGSLTQAGQGFGGRAGRGGKKEMIDILALGTASGLDKARMPEFFKGVEQLVQAGGTRTAGDVSGTGIASILAAFGQSGMAGLQGARGAAVLQKLDKGIRAPGGGEAGQALVLQAFGFGKPGGTTTYYEALKRQQQGVTGKQGAQNLIDIFQETRGQTGGGQQQIMNLSNMFGMDLAVLEEVRKVVEEQGLTAKEKQEKIAELTAGQKSIDEQILDSMKEFGDTAVTLAELEDRTLGIGEKVEEHMKHIRDSINKLVDHFMPQIVKALEVIADLLRITVDTTIGIWGDEDVTSSGKAQKSLKEGRSRIKELKQEFALGNISAEEYRARSLQVIGQLTSMRSKVGANEGIIDDLAEFAEDVNTGVARTLNQGWGLGYTIPETSNERERRLQGEIGQEIASVQASRNAPGRGLMSALRAFSQTAEGESLQGVPSRQQRQRAVQGDLRGEFIAFLEANEARHASTLEMVNRLASAVEQNVREQNEGPAAGARRTGGREPNVDTSGGVRQ